MDGVLAKALSKNPADRYPRCADFAQALAAAATGSHSAVSPSAPTQQAPVQPPSAAPAVAAQPVRGQHPRWILPAALGAVAALIVGLVLWRPWAADTTEPSNPTTGAEASNRSEGQSSAARGPAVPSKSDPDLGVGVPLSRPACDGTGIVILDSATTPGQYQQDIARALSNNPGASYLRTDLSCPSLRQQSDEGNPIYAVYRPAGSTKEQLCSAVRAAGKGTYGRWLDNTSDPDTPVECPKRSSADIVDVNPLTYLVPGRSDFYLWAYSVSPLRECRIFSVGANSSAPWAVSCDAEFPPGATAATPVPGLQFEKPNMVHIVPPKGPEIATGEGGVDRGKPMSLNRRITVGEVSCTTLPDNGVECSASTGGFRIEDGAVTATS